MIDFKKADVANYIRFEQAGVIGQAVIKQVAIRIAKDQQNCAGLKPFAGMLQTVYPYSVHCVSTNDVFE
jgi:hypothetical protein